MPQLLQCSRLPRVGVGPVQGGTAALPHVTAPETAVAPSRHPREDPCPAQSDQDSGQQLGLQRLQGFPCCWGPPSPCCCCQLYPTTLLIRLGAGGREGGCTLSCTDGTSGPLAAQGAGGDGHRCSTAPGHALTVPRLPQQVQSSQKPSSFHLCGAGVAWGLRAAWKIPRDRNMLQTQTR